MRKSFLCFPVFAKSGVKATVGPISLHVIEFSRVFSLWALLDAKRVGSGASWRQEERFGRLLARLGAKMRLVWRGLEPR